MAGPKSERLAAYVTTLITIAIVATVCWFIRDVLAFVILAALVALLASPLSRMFGKISVKGHHMPSWLSAVLSLISVFGVVLALFFGIFPLIRDISSDISVANVNDMALAVRAPLNDFNAWVISTFPKVGPDFKIESVALEQLQNIFDVSTFSAVVGSVTSFVVKLGIGLFSVIFISFFFIKDPGMASNIVVAFVPDEYEEKVRESLGKIGNLVSRYFVGLSIEVLGVALVSFLGLLLVARMGLRYSLGIAFMTALLNIIPYIGPLFGGIIGVSLSLIIKYVCASPFGLSIGLLPFMLVLIGIFVVTQWIDNYLFQPLIYSNSVNVHPLEIFIVFLIAGKIGGMTGMLVAIPAYTVIREVAGQFMGDIKAIKQLTAKNR